MPAPTTCVRSELRVESALACSPGSDPPSERFSWDDAAAVTLYVRYGNAVRSLCRRLLGDEEAGNDAAHDTFARVLAVAPLLHTYEDARRYLLGAARNVCINELRKRRTSPLDHVVTALLDRAACAQQHETAHSDADLVERFMSLCDERDRLIAVLHHVDGVTQTEIAARLGITRRTIHNRLAQVRANARSVAGTA